MKTEANPTNLTGLRSSMDAERGRDRERQIELKKERERWQEEREIERQRYGERNSKIYVDR